MALTLLSFTTAVQNAAAAAQAASSTILDFTVGSPFRAVIEASAGMFMWCQWLVLQVLGITRAATSHGADLDSWMADFSFVRLPGVAATGTVTFSRYSSAIASLILPGYQLLTADGSRGFTVATDTTNATWNPALGGYLVPAGQASVTVPVVATVVGTAGNVQPGTVTLIATAIAGIDTVTNASAFLNGAAAEQDPAFLARFAVYIAGLRQATLAGITAAIENVQAGLAFVVLQNQNSAGAYDPGVITVFVDDGSGAPATSLITAVGNAVNVARACGIQSVVLGPAALPVNVTMTITAAGGYTLAAVEAAVQAALSAFINAAEFGPTLSYVAMGTVASGVSGVASVSAGYTLNAGAIDLAAPAGAVFRAGTITIT